MNHYAHTLNKQSDNIQPWCTPFPICNQFVVWYLVLTVASWPTYRFLMGQVKRSGIPIFWRILQFVMMYTVKGLGIINKAEVDVFLEFSCSFYDPMDVENLISGSSAFYKSSLNIWKFSVHILLKPSLENFEHYFSIVWDECNCAVLNILWHCLSLELKWKQTFSSPVATVEFSKFAGILSATLSQHHLSGFEIAQMEFHHLH